MHNKKLNEKYYGRDIRPMLKDILRYLVIALVDILLFIVCWLIYAVTYERGKNGILTVRKARRIRALTKLKLWFYRHFKGTCKYLDFDLERLHKRLEK
jgi:hypothetical protein